MMLVLSKILITFASVCLLASVAERLGPRYAGLLAGFPLGTAIVLYFFALQQGDEFAGSSAVFTLAGLSGALAFAWGYWQVTRRRPQLSFLPVAAFVALLCFVGAIWLLQHLPANRIASLAVTLIAILVFHRLQRGIEPCHKIDPAAQPKHGHSFLSRSFLNPVVLNHPIASLVFRAALATLSVVLITAMGNWLAPSQAGLLAAFPVSFFPLMLLLHIRYGAQVLAASIRHYPTGMGALLSYCLTVSYSYPYLGRDIGTLVALVMACIYLLLNHYFSQAQSRR
ncbi:hypothetical protein GCM10011297_17240 [Bacterioplanes sanyensis]|uniref:hypothetical protein n=1 Tax=Bacterioplanes sanyensis TaxID=1249553 RepID=UPI001674E6B8|nr:hypothetical protein [Bacterioplanes sanyensis]GGY44815.1 hypothetical protein GCM10011297_17240 [Bacterioplanes sanyensis]